MVPHADPIGAAAAVVIVLNINANWGGQDKRAVVQDAAAHTIAAALQVGPIENGCGKSDPPGRGLAGRVFRIGVGWTGGG